jgi:hypothetical protein
VGRCVLHTLTFKNGLKPNEWKSKRATRYCWLHQFPIICESAWALKPAIACFAQDLSVPEHAFTKAPGSPVPSDKSALHRGGAVAAWRGGVLGVCYGWLSSAYGGAAGSQQGTSKAATGSGCKVGGVLVMCLRAAPVILSSENRLGALKPAMACSVSLHGSYRY